MQCKIPSEKFYGEFTFFYESLVVAAGGFFYNRRCQLMRKTKSEEKQMKKLISLVLAGIMTFSLAACGQNTTDNQTTAQNAQSTTTQSNEVQTAAAADIGCHCCG